MLWALITAFKQLPTWPIVGFDNLNPIPVFIGLTELVRVVTGCSIITRRQWVWLVANVVAVLPREND